MSEFKPIPGYEGQYKINTQGSIIGPYGKPLRVYTDGNYPKVYLYTKGKRRKHMVHTLVAITFIGPRPDGLVLRHLDGDRMNYALDNLAYGTHQENEADKLTHGTKLCGEKCHNSVLNERKVKIIRGLHKCDFPIKRIAEIFQIAYGTAWGIIKRKAWAHV